MTIRMIPLLLLSLVLFLAPIVGVPITFAADVEKLHDLVDRSRTTLDNFLTDSTMTWLRDHLTEAKGVFIVPRMWKGAFFFGGEGGSGIFLVKDDKTNQWSEPAFYSMGAGSFGFQFGVQASEIVLLVMSQRGVDSMLSSTFKLGAEVSVAAGPVGVGIEGATAVLSADMVTFARAKGIFGGISLEGAVIAVRDEWNRTYYGKRVRPTEILVKRTVKSPHSSGLRTALARAVTRPAKTQ